MIRSLYNGAAAMNVLQRQHEMIANNLANVSTAGFRRAELLVRGSGGEANRIGSGPETGDVHFDFSPGKLIQSGRKLDIALNGDGFFVLQGEGGQDLYTKSGQFHRDAESGVLLNEHGLPVQGEGGTITIGKEVADDQILVSRDGGIFAGEQQIGRFEIAAFENNEQLIPVSQSVFRRGPGAIVREANAEARQGFREVSNVNVTSELIALIVGGRHYDAVQKATRTISESLEQSIRA